MDQGTVEALITTSEKYNKTIIGRILKWFGLCRLSLCNSSLKTAMDGWKQCIEKNALITSDARDTMKEWKECEDLLDYARNHMVKTEKWIMHTPHLEDWQRAKFMEETKEEWTDKQQDQWENRNEY